MHTLQVCLSFLSFGLPHPIPPSPRVPAGPIGSTQSGVTIGSQTNILSRYLAPCTCFLPLTSVLVGVCRHRIGRHVLLCDATRHRSHGTPGAGGTGGRSGARCPRTHICDRPTRGPDLTGRNRRDGRATLGSFSVVGERGCWGVEWMIRRDETGGNGTEGPGYSSSLYNALQHLPRRPPIPEHKSNHHDTTRLGLRSVLDGLDWLGSTRLGSA
jgi:hypothetical protein